MDRFTLTIQLVSDITTILFDGETFLVLNDSGGITLHTNLLQIKVKKVNGRMEEMYLPKEYKQLEQYCEKQLKDVYIPRLQNEKVEISEDLKREWFDFCSELEQLESETEFIEISLLRHIILLKSDEPTFLIEAFDEKWLFDGLIYKKKVSLPTLSSILSSFNDGMKLEARKYINRLQFFYGEKVFLQYLPEFEETISKMLKEEIEMWLQLSQFNCISNPKLQISFGGYRFFQNKVYGEK